ncbi:MAG: GNAT family N-acetyltransferase [Deltaproteobacteria bacterium]|nr:GNAT family N-acetyltransferase [Deltaproteobacteria bacterium]MBW2254790.1 GNAT family N-acetyltransferase [Deltaproteobacteria bacterium]
MAAFPPRTLDTLRLHLRPGTLADAQAIFDSYATDPEVVRYLCFRPHQSLADTRVFLEAVERAWESGEGERALVIVHRDLGRIVGAIGIRKAGPRVEVGYVLERARWGEGLMTEVVVAVRDAAFADPDVSRFQALCDVENVASARVMEKAGMVLEGTLRSYEIHPNRSEVPRDCWCYAVVR